MRGSRPLSSLRAWADGLAHLQRQRGGQRVEFGHDAGAKALHHRQLLGQRHAAPGRLRGARGRGLGGDAGGVVGVRFGEQRAGGGVVDLQRGHAWCSGQLPGARRARRRESRSAAACRRRCRVVGVVELRVPLHGGHVARPALADRLDHAVVGQRASTIEARRQVLDALVVDAVDRARAARPGTARARRVPATSSIVVEVALVMRGVSRCASESGRCVAMSCSSVPPCITFSSWRPRQMPNTGLPALMKASTSSIS